MMDEKKEAIRKFWEDFCRESGVEVSETYQVWYFGNNSEMAKRLADLVLYRKKRATASLVITNEREPEKAPIEGLYSVITDFENNPLGVILTTEVRHVPFDEVDFQFAMDEDEGDETLEDWQKGHREYFTEELRAVNIEFNEKMLVACERFKLVYPKKDEF